TVSEVIRGDAIVLSTDNTISEVTEWLKEAKSTENHFLIVNADGTFAGTINRSDLYHNQLDTSASIETLVKTRLNPVKNNDSLRKAVEVMSKEGEEVLPVVSSANPNRVIGVLSYKEIIKAYSNQLIENEEANANISLKRQRIKVLIKGRRLIRMK